MGNVYSQNAVAKYLENSSILKARLKVVFNFLLIIFNAGPPVVRPVLNVLKFVNFGRPLHKGN